MSVNLKKFNKTLLHFLEWFQKQFPEEKYLESIYSIIELAMLATPNKILEGYLVYVYPNKEQIFKKDESFIINRDLNNDLEELIVHEQIGRVCTERSVKKLKCLAEDLLKDISVDLGMRSRCLALSKKMFSPDIAVNQIVRALSQ